MLDNITIYGRVGGEYCECITVARLIKEGILGTARTTLAIPYNLDFEELEERRVKGWRTVDIFHFPQP